MTKSQPDIDVWEVEEFYIPNSSYFSRLYCLDYILTKLDRKNRRMALTISDKSKKEFENVTIKPPEYIVITFIEEWELSDSDILNFDYHPVATSVIIPQWGPEEKPKKSLLQIGVAIRLNLLYQIKIEGLICPSPNDWEWIRVGKIEVVK